MQLLLLMACDSLEWKKVSSCIPALDTEGGLPLLGLEPSWHVVGKIPQVKCRHHLILLLS